MARTATPMVKLKPETHARLQEIAKEEDQTMGDVITLLIDKYERERFWKGVAEDLETLNADKKAYRQYQDEFAEWDNMTTESLINEPPFYEDEEK